MKKITILLLLAIATAGTLHAQEDRPPSLIKSTLRGWSYGLKAGFNIGGTSPLPLPAEIRSINGFTPNMSISIEGNATKWFDVKKQWGLSIALRLESKNMSARAMTKNYGMKIISGDQMLEGLWTGGVRTKVRLSYLTFPVLANYQVSERWKVVLGPYVSYRMEGEFSGNVYDGHLRTPDETGSRVDFTGNSTATYDFSHDLTHWAYGVQAGGEWKALKRLTVHADLTWGLNDIFNSDFETITFAMYPIYLNLGFGYSF
jgi:hypothetical protein